MAYENDNSSAVPPPVSLPTEEEVRARIEAVAGLRYRKQRKQLDANLAELSADTRRWVLLAVFREYQMEPPARRRQRRPTRRTVSEPRIDETMYHQKHARLEALLRQIEEHPLVYSFCRAHLVRYPIEEAICPSHGRWTKWCPECHGLDGSRGRGRPRDETRRRLLNAIIPLLKADKCGTKPQHISCMRSILRCLGEGIEAASLRRYWDRFDREAKETERALATAWNTIAPFSQIRDEWNPQPDKAPCRCPPRDAT
jgi:hypothetical protein